MTGWHIALGLCQGRTSWQEDMAGESIHLMAAAKQSGERTRVLISPWGTPHNDLNSSH
jgi:hypothetical protein